MDVRTQTQALTPAIRACAPLALALLLAAALALPAAAQGQFYDPLTRAEADRVRHTSEELNKRPPLLLHFAHQRLDRFQRLRVASPPPPARGAQLYNLLRQYAAILQEADDSVDQLFHARAQYKTTPKVLRQVVAEESAMQAELHAIRSASSPADLARYHFELDNCLDLTADCLQNAQEDLARAGGKSTRGDLLR